MALGPEKLSGPSRKGPQSVHSNNKFSVSYGLLRRRMSRMCKRGRKKTREHCLPSVDNFSVVFSSQFLLRERLKKFGFTVSNAESDLQSFLRRFWSAFKAYEILHFERNCHVVRSLSWPHVQSKLHLTDKFTFFKSLKEKKVIFHVNMFC